MTTNLPLGNVAAGIGGGSIGGSSGGATTLAALSDVDLTGAADGKVLTKAGTKWVPADAPAGSGGGATTTASRNHGINPPIAANFPTTLGGASHTITDSVGDGLVIQTTGSGQVHRVRDLPAGAAAASFFIATRLRIGGPVPDAQAGLSLGVDADSVVGVGILNPWSSSGAPRLYIGGRVGGVHTDIWYDRPYYGDWLGVRLNPAGSVTVLVSPDGRNWAEAWTDSIGFAPTKYGLYASSPGGVVGLFPYFFSDEFPAPAAAPV